MGGRKSTVAVLKDRLNGDCLAVAPKLDRDSEACKLMVAAGWTIGEPYFVEEENWNPPGTPALIEATSIRVNFTCLCGRQEIYAHLLSAEELLHSPAFRNNKWDACREIEKSGAVSVEHLRGDGFDEKTIERVMFVYGMRDELRKLRREVVLLRSYAPSGYVSAGGVSYDKYFSGEMP